MVSLRDKLHEQVHVPQLTPRSICAQSWTKGHSNTAQYCGSLCLVVWCRLSSQRSIHENCPGLNRTDTIVLDAYFF